MAKLFGPLHSDSASGQIAKAMVFFAWKGIAVVRKYLIPANPQSAAQGDNRIFLGGTGRAVGKIYPNTGHTNVGAFAQQLIDLSLIPVAQTKQSYMVQYVISQYLADATAYAAMLSEFTNHSGITAWRDAADTLDILAFDLAYADVAPYDKGLGLYLIAKAAIALGFTGTPYTLSQASWVTASVNSMISDFTKS